MKFAPLKSKILILFLSLSGLQLLIGSSAAAGPPSGFIEIEPYTSSSTEMSCANFSKDEWNVSIENSQLRISKAAKKVDAELVLKNGKFIGRDRGEFGGGLDYVRGSEKQNIFDKNISYIFGLQDGRVVAFGGIAHMSLDEGYMLILREFPIDHRWKVEKRISLGAYPYAVAAGPENSFLFISSGSLSQVNAQSLEIKKLKPVDVESLYPNSAVIAPDKNIYVGMRHAVAQFRPTGEGYKYNWLVQQRCVLPRDKSKTQDHKD